MTKLYDENIVPDCPVIGMMRLSYQGCAEMVFAALSDVVSLHYQTKGTSPKHIGELAKSLRRIGKSLRRNDEVS